MHPGNKWFKSLASIALLLLSVLLTTCTDGLTGSSLPQGDEPRASYTRDAVDFGRIPLRRIVSYTYVIKNTGGAPLKIEKVELNLVEGC